MPETQMKPDLESAKSAVLLVREAAITAAVLGLILLLPLGPGKLRGMLERAGIQSVKLPMVEIETALEETGKQLAEAKAQVESARQAAKRAQEELAAAKAQLDEVVARKEVNSDSQAKLQVLSGQLEQSKSQVEASTRALKTSSGVLSRSAERQMMLRRRIDILQGAK